MDTQQIPPAGTSVPPTAVRLDSNVVSADSDDWARSTASALGTDYNAVPSSSVPGATAQVVNSNDRTALDTSSKSQADVQRTMAGDNTTSTVSTPGLQLPGAWTDHRPSTDVNQIYTDVGNALTAVGQGAYNLLPDSVKNAVSSSPTKTTSPIQTTTNNSEPNTSTTGDYARTAAGHASTAAGVIAGAAAAGATTVGEHAQAAYNSMTGEGVDKSKTSQPPTKTATLPSQDVSGQPPYTHTDGVGALPGSVSEQGVAVLPEQRDTSTNFPQQPVQSSIASKNQPDASHTSKGIVAGVTGAAAGTAAFAGEKFNSMTSTGDSVDKTKPAQPTWKTATLPSQDVEGQQPYTHVDGAGALPGNVHEQNVAVLPDARDASTNFSQQPTESTVQPSTTASYTTALTGAAAAAAAAVTAGAGVAYNKASEVVANPTAFVPGMGSTQPATSMPSQELEGQQPFEHTDGAGALPGRITEESVAKLPEEKANPDPLATATAEYAAANKNTKLASPYNPDSPYSDTRANAVSQPGTGIKGKAEEVKERVTPNKSTSDGAHPSQNQSGMKGKAEDVKERITPSKSASTGAESETSGGSSPTKKSGFMSKLKGEAKIISGKLSHNEGKIEEGMRLKSGGQP